MGNFSINVNGEIQKPNVDNNSGKLNNVVFTFDTSSFVKNWVDPQGGNPSQVTIESLPTIIELQFNSNPAIVGLTFSVADSGLLSFNLAPKYAIHNSHLYEFSKSIDLIISDYDALGYKLLHNTNGILTFIDPNNLTDIIKVQGTAVEELDTKFTFTTRSSTSNIKSNVATFNLIPWENVNIKDNFILTSANSGIDNPVTGHTIEVDPNDSTKKISSITLQDGTVLTTTFTDNDSTTTISVIDANTRTNRTKIASVESTDLYETITALITPVLDGSVLTLKFRNENGVEQSVQVDLSTIIPSNDINIDSAEYNAATNIITITETNGDVYNIDLSEFSIEVVTNPDGSVNINQEGVTKIAISKVGISNDYNDLDNLPSLNFDNYLNWVLKVNGDAGDSIISQEVVELLSGSNITLSRTGNQITITATDTNDNSYIIGGNFNSTTGDITLNRNDGLSDIVFNLDNRYLQEVNWDDILNKPDYDNSITNLVIPASEVNVSDWTNEQEVRDAVINWINTNTKNKVLGEDVHIEFNDDVVSVTYMEPDYVEDDYVL